ncbi:MAG TPA: ACP phosphodiesterase [Rhodocyclaceae bacterium]|nr:ACP phosphodiesterase [Rhodocyclaceae bacterium]
MNFLAHAFLADADPALIVGGVIGDWIKGPLPGPLPADLARGVALHRAIDSHAETQAAFRASRARISPARRRYGGVVVDILYDHLLASRWHELHARPLDEFCAGVYRLINARLGDIPPSAHFALQLMADEDWLSSYRHIDGIADVLARMSRRARQPNPLLHAEQEYLGEPEGYDLDFRHWLVDAQRFVGQWSLTG